MEVILPTQKLITEHTEMNFKDQVNYHLKDAWRIVPGTIYVSHSPLALGSITYFIVLEKLIFDGKEV